MNLNQRSDDESCDFSILAGKPLTWPGFLRPAHSISVWVDLFLEFIDSTTSTYSLSLSLSLSLSHIPNAE
jgi:hypothetical protein